MKFVLSDSKEQNIKKVVVQNSQDNPDDIDILVDGKLIAWFCSEHELFGINKSNFRDDLIEFKEV